LEFCSTIKTSTVGQPDETLVNQRKERPAELISSAYCSQMASAIFNAVSGDTPERKASAVLADVTLKPLRPSMMEGQAVDAIGVDGVNFIDTLDEVRGQVVLNSEGCTSRRPIDGQS
jgi:hypothetical protein